MNTTPTHHLEVAMRSETHPVPDHSVEVQLRHLYGTRYAVRVLEVRERPVKDDWRQIGSEVVYGSEQEARSAANAEWLRLRAGNWHRSVR